MTFLVFGMHAYLLPRVYFSRNKLFRFFGLEIPALPNGRRCGQCQNIGNYASSVFYPISVNDKSELRQPKTQMGIGQYHIRYNPGRIAIKGSAGLLA